MAKNVYIGVGSAAKKVKKIYFGVGNVAKKVKKAYIGVGGVAKLFWSGGEPLSDVAVVGNSVFMNVNGKRTEFIIVNIGNPNTTYYGGAADGVWILMKDIWKVDYYHGSNVYPHRMSGVLNNTFLSQIDSNIKEKLNIVKIPYWDGTPVSSSSGGDRHYGEDGLEQRAFLLSLREAGKSANKSSSSQNGDGLYGQTQTLEYFGTSSMGYSTAKDQCVAYYNGVATDWWTRSPAYEQQYYEHYVTLEGKSGYRTCRTETNADGTYKYVAGIRPAMVLPYDILVDDSGNIVA